jgi:hypothetical protein
MEKNEIMHKIAFSSPLHPEGLRDPPSILLNGYQVALLQVMCCRINFTLTSTQYLGKNEWT